MPLPAAAAAAIPAVISGVGSLVGSIFGKKSTDSANKTNIELAKYQNDWNLAQWNRENEYNLPINQMMRLKEAGLNPNLVYGSGASTLAASSPKAAGASVRPYTGFNLGIGDAVNSYVSVSRMAKENALADSQVQVNNQQQLESAQRIAESASREASNKFDLGLKRKLESTQLEAALENLNQVRNSNEVSRKQQKLMDLEIEMMPLKRRLTEKQIRQLDAAVYKMSLDSNLLEFERDLNKIGLRKEDPWYFRILNKMLEFSKPVARFAGMALGGQTLKFIDNTRGR